MSEVIENLDSTAGSADRFGTRQVVPYEHTRALIVKLEREINEAKAKLETVNAVHDRYFQADNAVRERLVSSLGSKHGYKATLNLIDLLIAQLAAVTKDRDEALAELAKTKTIL